MTSRKVPAKRARPRSAADRDALVVACERARTAAGDEGLPRGSGAAKGSTWCVRAGRRHPPWEGEASTSLLSRLPPFSVAANRPSCVNDRGPHGGSRRAAAGTGAPASFAIALLIGIAGAAVLVAAAGARRTASSLDRFRAESRAGDVELDISSATPEQIAELRAIRRSRASACSARSCWPRPAPTSGAGTSRGRPRSTRRSGATSTGRTSDRGPARPSEPRARDRDQRDVRVDVRSRRRRRPRARLVLSRADRARRDGRARSARPPGPRVRFRIVGIVRRPLDLGVRGASGGFLVPTPAFHGATGTRSAASSTRCSASAPATARPVSRPSSAPRARSSATTCSW